jgi:hypothetical protein
MRSSHYIHGKQLEESFDSMNSSNGPGVDNNRRGSVWLFTSKVIVSIKNLKRAHEEKVFENLDLK